MASRSSKDEPSRSMPPARTPEAREGQLISLATDLTERQLRDGTASAQVITHYLKLGSTREKLEQERLRKENELLTAKVRQLDEQKQYIELVENALNAMRSYTGQDGDYDH